MTHWIIMPAVLPALTAAGLILLWRHDLNGQRIVSVAATASLLLIAMRLLALASDDRIRPYLLGDWPAPFGIILVLDRLSAMMLALTAALALLVVLYAVATNWDARGRYFHALFQFQLLGVNGAFLTGDIFNLFVFFEVMLIASYGLLLHGGGAQRLKVGFQFVTINLIASTSFLFAVGIIYAVTGALNMADLAVKVRSVPEADQALLATGAGLLFVVFAIKAAVVPFHWWLPGAYAAASAPVAALFMIMTKVGAYAMARVYGLVFPIGPDASAHLVTILLVPAALITLVLGTVGVLASPTVRGLAAFATLASMGTLLIAIGLWDQSGMTAGLYYVLHSTVAGAALFLVADLIASARGPAEDRLVAAPLRDAGALGILFFAAAIALVGLPPLAGFVGKLLVLQSSWRSPLGSWIWTAVLGASLLMLIGFARAGSVLFWKSAGEGASQRAPAPGSSIAFAIAGMVVAMNVALALLAGPALMMSDATARQLLTPSAYVQAVLGRSYEVFKSDSAAWSRN